ncbi:hypothetical protein WG66_010839, partial [Moniliophthora roreri]
WILVDGVVDIFHLFFPGAPEHAVDYPVRPGGEGYPRRLAVDQSSTSILVSFKSKELGAYFVKH